MQRTGASRAFATSTQREMVRQVACYSCYSYYLILSPHALLSEVASELAARVDATTTAVVSSM